MNLRGRQDEGIHQLHSFAVANFGGGRRDTRINVHNLKWHQQLLKTWTRVKRLTGKDFRPNDSANAVLGISRKLLDRQTAVEQPIDDDIRVEERIRQG